MPVVNEKSCHHCYLDIDIDDHRSKLAIAASFVNATDSRYGFSSNDLRKLGGSELARIDDLAKTDYEWSEKIGGGIQLRPPVCGNRVVIKLFWDIAPLACENFATLCTNGNNSISNEKKIKKAPIGNSGKPLTYKDSMMHRIVKGSFVQGGDFVFSNGSGGESIYNGKKFKDERGGLSIKHNKKGLISMGNNGKNSNTSQFFITFRAMPQCDGKHVVFGEVISGFEVLDALASMETDGDKPSLPIRITSCGAFHPLRTPGAGYWYDQPDEESITGATAVFMVRPRVAIVAAKKIVCEKFSSLFGTYVSSTHISVETVGSVDGAISMVHDLLASFAVDLVVIAPVYADAFENFSMPSSWLNNDRGATLPLEEVVISSKPVDAPLKIRTLSYMGKNTLIHLDGAP